MYFAQCIGKPALAAYDASLAGVVGAVCKPQDQHIRSNSASNLDGCQYVFDRAASHRLIFVGDRPMLVALVLEEIRVDGSNAETARVGKGS